jgi:hypothetical protein
MKYAQPSAKPVLRSRDTLFRPDFMLQAPSMNRLAKTQLGQRKAVNTSGNQETNEVLDVAWWQDR